MGVPCWIKVVPNHLKTREMCYKAVGHNPYMLRHILDQYKTQGMCIEAVHRKPYALGYVPDHLRSSEKVPRVNPNLGGELMVILTPPPPSPVGYPLITQKR